MCKSVSDESFFLQWTSWRMMEYESLANDRYFRDKFCICYSCCRRNSERSVCVLVRRVLQLVWSTDYYPLLLFHVGMNDAGSQNTGRIKDDHKTLGAQMKNTHAQDMSLQFSSWRKEGSQKQTHNADQFLATWTVPRLCFGFYDSGTFNEDYNLLKRDGIHLPGRGRDNLWQQAG